MIRQLILDTETTGFDPVEGHRIIELAALEMLDRKLTGNSLHLYFNPERDIPIEATNVHGLTLKDVAHQPTFREQVDQVITFIEGAELIIHNAKFDLNFLDHHFNELNKKPTQAYAAGVIDTLLMARNKFPGSKNNLDALCDRFNVDRSNRNYHGALVDCELLSQVYINLTREQISLLAEEKSKTNSSNHKFRIIDNPNQYNFVNVKISPEEQELHNNYLEQLKKTSKDKCIWANEAKDSANG